MNVKNRARIADQVIRSTGDAQAALKAAEQPEKRRRQSGNVKRSPVVVSDE
jgi:hypothetical protein